MDDTEKTMLNRLNAMTIDKARNAFLLCCGVPSWAEEMEMWRPYTSIAKMESTAETIWRHFLEREWREAFAHHPKIGDISSLRTRFATTREWASGEQAGTAMASEETLQALAAGNATYEARFGYIFIVCATGKSAEEMLALLNTRLPNDPATELNIAAEEQKKITRLRLRKL